MTCITKEQQDAIAQQWREHAKAFDLKPGTKRYKDAQTHFVAGACTALHHTDPDAPAALSLTPDTYPTLSTRIPVAWVLGPMCGRDPFNP